MNLSLLALPYLRISLVQGGCIVYLVVGGLSASYLPS